MKSFKKLGLSEEILRVIEKKGFETPTPIQEKVISALLGGDKDIIGQAQTGTGKTAAFGLPLVELLKEDARCVQALILTPTRELAIQVAEEIHSLKGKKAFSIIPIYGGQSIELQLRHLKKGVDIVVGTPGRILDHLRRRTLKLDNISFLVLDEADEMLNMGFIDDVREIMRQTRTEKRTMLFSATMPQEIMRIAKKYMGEYEVFKVSEGQLTVSLTEQIYFEVSAADKFEALCRIIDIEEEFYGLVFCRTRVDVNTITNHMIERSYDADGLHGDMSQAMREKILNKFKKRFINILIATDVAARGIDVQNLTHVINYSLPHDSLAYVHRIGRTGRAGKGGNAITFITPEEYRKLQYIQKGAKTEIRKAKLPRVEEVIKAKKRMIKTYIKDIVKDQLKDEYVEMSRELLEKNSSEHMVAALLQYAFRSELDEKNYVEIGEAVVDKKGKTRLFVKQGRRDGLTPKKLERIISDKCNIKKRRIQDLQIFDRFSFITLPFNDAENVLLYFKRRKKGSEPFITKAKR